MLKPLLTRIYENASDLNRRNILWLCRRAAAASGAESLLDLGCDDGAWTVSMAEAVRSKEVVGVEIVGEAARRARERGVRVHQLDLNAALDLPSGHFDLVHANQVIEHVASVDLFVSEVYRLLKPGGHAVISTENGSSWHNVFAAIMGWQIFSATNVSSLKAGLGNPFAIQRGGTPYTGTWTHKTIFNYCGLIEMLEVHGFCEVGISGAGYFPLPAILGRFDARHGSFITAIARK
jgi:SAM-dependent methyltransferase